VGIAFLLLQKTFLSRRYTQIKADYVKNLLSVLLSHLRLSAFIGG